jgi:hypothetical protein
LLAHYIGGWATALFIVAFIIKQKYFHKEEEAENP